ncbi:hypothetical protein EV383_4367 [Pseudonocardia sediminis]|uniref:Uncharacterized protein n=1 Tax=Pseudonocardia sediminis TaxID=1397368 RepID=A0A4Q7V405_PSEST|nr:hypothetical protein [Pseudonocardia sediminis]RZT87443.1 hypothetical protein EV383_4367 [Pseudonocardia sediminis]
MTRPALVVRDGRHPFEVAVLIACVVIGVFGLVGPQLRSAAIDLAWGSLASAAWYALVGGFALLGLWAVTCPRLGDSRLRQVALLRVHLSPLLRPISLRRSLQVERVAMYGMGWPLCAFLPAALASSGPAGATAGSVFLGLAIASGVRIRQIHVDLRKLDTLVTVGVESTPVISDPDGE